jgi:rhomboid protease GluP
MSSSPDAPPLLSFPPRVNFRPPTATRALLISMAVYFAMAQIAGGTGNLAVLVAFGANFGPLVEAGDTWRLVTSIFLHAGWIHLALNGWALYVLGRNVEAFYGAWKLLAIFLLSGLLGSIASARFSHAISVGASGGIFGLLGASVVFAFRWREKLRSMLLSRVTRVMGTALLPWVALNLALGVLVPRIDMAAHLGGLVGGVLLGMVLVPDALGEADGPKLPFPRVVASVCASLLIVSFASAASNIFRMRGQEGPILDPRVVPALMELDRPDALHTLDDALARTPDDPALLLARADVRAAARNWHEAAADYRRVLRLSPDDVRALNNLAWLLLEEAPESMRDRAEAERFSARAAQLSPADPYILGTYGAARLRAGAPEDAVRLLERALAVPRPAEDEATDRYLLAIARANAGRAAEARQALDKARAEEPVNAYRAEAESAIAAAESTAAETQRAPAP